jgi:hypothetical protein
MNSLFLHRLRLSAPASLTLAACGAGLVLALWQQLSGELEILEAWRYAGAVTAFCAARLLATCSVCRTTAT